MHNAVQPEPSKSIEQVLPLRISPSQLGNFLDEFEVLQSVFSIQKVYLKKERKKYTFGKKKIETTFKGPKNLKLAKTHFW